METILCAAIHYNKGEAIMLHPKNIYYGYVICGYRHCDCLCIIRKTENKKQDPKLMIQGFLTSGNRFVGRSEGYIIASKAGQIKNNIGRDKILYSENLY